MVADAAGSGDRADAVLIDAQDLIVAADFGQIYIVAYTSATPDELGDEDEYDPDSDVVLHEATTSGRFVGVRRWSIRLFTPGQYNPRTPMRLEVWSAEPADDRDGWDHEVDVDLDVPDGLLHIAAPVDTKDQEIAATIPAGDYRVRVSGRGFTELGAAGAYSDDSYRLRLWPRNGQNTPMLRKRWPGWDRHPVPPWPAPASGSPQLDQTPRPGDPTAASEVVQRPGAVVVVALDAADRVLVMAAHPVGAASIELPAALLADADEDPLAAAHRVLVGAADLSADTWNTLLDLPAFDGGLDEPSRVYLARGLNPGAAHTPGCSWTALNDAVDDVFTNVIGNGVAAAAIVATAQARDTSWHPLQPADLPNFRLGSAGHDQPHG